MEAAMVSGPKCRLRLCHHDRRPLEIPYDALLKGIDFGSEANTHPPSAPTALRAHCRADAHSIQVHFLPLASAT